MKFYILVTGLSLAFAAAGQAQQPVQAPAAPYVRNPLFWPMPVMDTTPPRLPARIGKSATLIFSKTNGFRDDEQIKAANVAIEAIVRKQGRQVFVTENAAIFNPDQLRHFSVVVFNSTSGDMFTGPQRAAFEAWLKQGGGLVALHGAGGDGEYAWRWYVETVLGAQFIGHTSKPHQFQQAAIRVVAPDHPVMKGLPSSWQRTDEWYAFDRVPTGNATRILATLDEASYAPAEKHRMGLHPIIWTRCVDKGRVFFSALGHKAETYSEPAHLTMIDGALRWAAEARRKGCD